MKFLVVLMWSAFLILISFTVASDDTVNSIPETYNLTNSTNLALAGCPSRCGDLIVPYPFGISNIGSNCSIDEGFDIYCNTSLNPPRAYFSNHSYAPIIQISDSTLRTSGIVARRCYSPNGTISQEFHFMGGGVTGYWPYTFSKLNKFTVIGCDDYARLIRLTNGSEMTQSISSGGGCMAFCPNLNGDAVPTDDCSGIGCCQSSIPKDITKNYFIKLYTMLNSSETRDNRSLNHCTYAFVGVANAFKFNGATDLNDTNFVKRIEDTVPRLFEWAIGNTTCAEAKATSDFACQFNNSECVDSKRETGGYRCVCRKGYEGNPYLSPGCQDINECNYRERFPCYGVCINTIGDYTCKCKGGSSGDATRRYRCKHKPLSVLRLLLGMGFGFLVLLIGLLSLHFMVQKRKLIKLREKLFEQNGGVLLEDKLRTVGGSSFGFMKIFRVEELEEATNNYAKDRILGKGGNGTVYKGILPDKRVVAIKKSQRLDEEQRGQFINEMIILAQLNHPNVVQLLGCCLEIDVPLLAYEFVSNDTLYHHIHNKTSGSWRLSWDSRLRIAQESAGALAYLHRDARMSIIHRDVKSTNILLDDTYTAKIADFGASRLVPLGNDQVTTLVQGTLGYLDPEYFHTGQLTDKSDVYSFGVVLAELLTGKKPLGIERGLEDRTLVTYFLKVRKENRLYEILDRQLVKEATDEQLNEACDLVCRCLNQVGGNRPCMKEVTMELEALRKKGKQHPWNVISQGRYTETSTLMIETKEHDLCNIPLVT